jgi:molybdenum cofactor biosynthesis enzyme MoaA
MDKEVKGCLMCDSLYVKANGELPCWDDVGEDLILGSIDERELLSEEDRTLFHSPALVEIRRAFLEGRDPHPGVCSRCAVRGHGVAASLHPGILRVLHVEPCYLCQLACPQCIAPRLRLQLKGPPYYMSPSFYEALLLRLRKEGVRHVQMVHFEGRGDPLLNQHLDEMIRATKAAYPGACVMATSHGNYPFRPWMLDSGLDLLRLSVDGAFDDSYVRYRVGGRLQAPLDLMRAIRDRRREIASRLRVEWKYILFEWNDSDEEIREAARLAEELEVDLRFCLTHSPGRSVRFRNLDGLQEALAILAPKATRTLTFQRKPGPEDAHVAAEHAEAHLLAALESYRSGQQEAGRSSLIEALVLDPGLDRAVLEASGEHPARRHLPRILAEAVSPSTLSALANIHLVLQESEAAEQLFRGYLRLAPEAPDRVKVQQALAELAPAPRPARRFFGREGVIVGALALLTSYNRRRR